MDCCAANGTAFPSATSGHRYLADGGNLFVSGAYIGSDLCRGKKAGHADMDFCNNVLRCRWDAGHAAARGRVESVDSLFLPLHSTWQFAQAGSDSLYGVEAPDALSAYGGSRTVLRYEENQFSAAVAYKDGAVAVCGFPFETMYPAFQRIISCRRSCACSPPYLFLHQPLRFLSALWRFCPLRNQQN